MASAEPAWELYRSFLAVLEAGSLSAAARALGLAQPTVGRHIEALERALAVALFTRSAAGLRPTERAIALRPHAESMAMAARAIVRMASADEAGAAGAIRLTASDIVGVEILPAILTRFREAHPNIIIELALSNAQQDLLNRDADIAVRMARPTQGALFARRIGAVRVGLYAHRDYLARHGVPKSLADLARHSIVGVDRAALPAEVAQVEGLALGREIFALRTDNDLAQIAAVRAGFGVGACQPAIAARDPDLIAVLPGAFAFELEMWVVMHEDLKTIRRMRLLFDHLVAELARVVAPRTLPARAPSL